MSRERERVLRVHRTSMDGEDGGERRTEQRPTDWTGLRQQQGVKSNIPDINTAERERGPCDEMIL
jgi:hypothetical protein